MANESEISYAVDNIVQRVIPGHEVTGIVENVGAGVTAFAPGDRAGVPWMQYACGRC